MGAKMLSYDERLRITDAYERLHNAKTVAAVFGISVREVYSLAQKRKAGDLAPKTHTRGRKSKLSPEQRQAIGQLVEDRPDITLADIKKALDLPISISRLCRILRSEGFRLKKKVMHASEQKRPRCTEEAQGVESVHP